MQTERKPNLFEFADVLPLFVKLICKVHKIDKNKANFAIAKLQSYQQADYLNIIKNKFLNFATTKTTYITNNQCIKTNFANFAKFATT